MEYTIRAEYSYDNGITWGTHLSAPPFTSLDDGVKWIKLNGSVDLLHRLSLVLRYEPPTEGQWVDDSTTR